jgi:hypothetical protein
MEIDAAITKQVIEKVELTALEQPSKKLAVFALVGLFAVFLASVLFRPPAGEYFTVCGFKNFTGLPCPGCGLTHSFCALGKGEIADAFGFNLLGPPLFLVLVLIWIRSACVLSNRIGAAQLLDRIAGRFNIAWTFAIAFAVYGIARIIYLLTYDQVAFGESPLARLISRIL